MGSQPGAFSSTIHGTTLPQLDVLQLVSPRDGAEARLPAVFAQSCLFLQPLHPASPRNIFPGQTPHIMTKAEGHRFSRFVYSLQLFSCFNEKKDLEAHDVRDKKVWKAADV